MTVYLIDLESVPTRYTCQWKIELPKQLKNAGVDVVVIDGTELTNNTTTGAFLNFSSTNIYKSTQLVKIAELFLSNKINDGDYFLYTDAWNPSVIQLKYMSELLNKKVTIGGLWHAGHYDPHDFLGRIDTTAWIEHAEQSMFNCYDHNFFASDFHISLFLKKYNVSNNSIRRVGWPMEYLKTTLEEYKSIEKENIILFPHRISIEKQLAIFKDLEKELPEYTFIVCQEKQLSKHEYHTLLAKAKLVFSASLQETLGICMGAEGPLLNAIPLVPNRLSYHDIFTNYNDFVYPSKWTENFETYMTYKPQLLNRIKDIMENYLHYKKQVDHYVKFQYNYYFSGKQLYYYMKENNK